MYTMGTNGVEGKGRRRESRVASRVPTGTDTHFLYATYRESNRGPERLASPSSPLGSFVATTFASVATCSRPVGG